MVEKKKLTPPELAAQWGIAPAKVIGWIRRGELRAINAADRPGGRPRYLIDADDLAAFENTRAVVPPAPRAKRRDWKTVNDNPWY